MPVDTLSLSTSSPVATTRKKTARSISESALVVPIELENGCTEEGVVIESDDITLTNAIRKHYLEHFGHRDMDALLGDYSDDAMVIQVVNGKERTKHHGKNEIRIFLEQLFEKHPAGESTFELQHISVEQRHAMVNWSAKTPTAVLPQSSDTLVYNTHNKIIKQFLNMVVHAREDPGTSNVIRKDQEKEYQEFFKE